MTKYFVWASYHVEAKDELEAEEEFKEAIREKMAPITIEKEDN